MLVLEAVIPLMRFPKPLMVVVPIWLLHQKPIYFRLW